MDRRITDQPDGFGPLSDGDEVVVGGIRSRDRHERVDLDADPLPPDTRLINQFGRAFKRVGRRHHRHAGKPGQQCAVEIIVGAEGSPTEQRDRSTVMPAHKPDTMSRSPPPGADGRPTRRCLPIGN